MTVEEKQRLRSFYFKINRVPIPHPIEKNQPDDVFFCEYWTWIDYVGSTSKTEVDGEWRNFHDWYVDDNGVPTPQDKSHPKTTIGPEPSEYAWNCLLEMAKLHGYEEK